MDTIFDPMNGFSLASIIGAVELIVGLAILAGLAVLIAPALTRR